jgi:uncharacterized protein YecE (DUF72 family)
VVSRGSAVRIGCSGYEYDHWRGEFYPADLAKTRWFDHYAAVFDTVEVNGTFYSLPAPETFDRWRSRAPRGFIYALKLSQYGTHRKKLKDPEGWVSTFVDRVRRLGPTLGPILAQLPPRWGADPGRLDQFLAAAAAASPSALRWAVEVRDRSWLRHDIYEVLRQHGSALVVHDLIDDHPHVATADWVYLRFHGPEATRGTDQAYTGGYSPQALSGAARRIRRHLAEGRDVYAYFNNDVGGHAVHDAQALRRYVSADSDPGSRP